MRSFFTTISILAAIVIAISGWFFWNLNSWAHRPAGTGQKQVLITVFPGQGADALAARLANKGLLTSKWRFKLLARLKAGNKSIKVGEYKLNNQMAPVQLLEILTSGKVNLHRLTIPEGFDLKQIAARLVKSGLMPARVFLQQAFNAEFVHRLGIEANNFEGYLFPDTYHLPAGITPQRLIILMVERFNQQFTPQWRRRAAELHMTIHQVVTLASIIEKETGAAKERPIISSVFHNRLNKGMRLESDPTVIYAIPNFDGNLTRKHLRTYSPYNTYRIKGLPPGPIANPGRQALEAALFPAHTNYLYFVAKKDGTHYFSTNIKEHNRAVRRYQLRQRPRKRNS